MGWGWEVCVGLSLLALLVLAGVWAISGILEGLRKSDKDVSCR